MTVMVALLRGINVGGSTTLPMARLRDIVSECGYEHVRTYIQSGNVVFTTSARSTTRVARELEAAIAASSTVKPAVIVRTREELAEVVAANPFLARGEDAAHQHALFLPAGIDADAVPSAPSESGEAAAPGPGVVYLHLPHGVGRSAFASAVIGAQGPAGTMRNWRTVTKLLSMADALA